MKRLVPLLIILLAFSAFSLIPAAHAASVVLTFNYSVQGGGSPTAPTFTYYNDSDTLTVKTMKTSAVGYNVWVGTTWTVSPNPLTGSGGTERWETVQVLTGTASTSQATTFAFYNQYGPTVSYTLTDPNLTTNPTFTYYQHSGLMTSPNSKAGAQIWIDAGTAWTAQNPFVTSPDLTTTTPSPTTGTVSSASAIVVAYSSSASCLSSSILTMFENGCLVPALINSWTGFLGQQAWFSIVLLGVNVAVYNKSQSVVVAMIVLMVFGGVFWYLFPASFGNIAIALVSIAVSGLLVKLVLMAR
jgi:hypothetical protein